MNSYFNTRRFLFVILATSSFAASVFAKDDDAFSTKNRSVAARSDVVMPIVSFVLPGTSQWISDQYGHASVYSGLAIGGISYAGQSYKDIDEADRNNAADLNGKGIAQRKYLVGGEIYQTAGGFSLYHQFRTSARIRQGEGEYQFLTSDPTPGEIALAPFDYRYLARPTTYIPLIVGAGLNYWIAALPPPDGYSRDAFRKEDAAFVGALSYGAGTSEEATFRGWLMPVLHQYGMNEPWSNGVQAAAFGAAHLSSTSFPIIQFILGWHFGSLTQKNNYDIREGVFIHAWWDVMAFTAQYKFKKDHPESKNIVRLNLPPLTLNF